MFTPPSVEEIRDAEPDTANGGVEFMEEDERVFPDVLPAAQPGRTNAEEQEDLNKDRGNYFAAGDLELLYVFVIKPEVFADIVSEKFISEVLDGILG